MKEKIIEPPIVFAASVILEALSHYYFPLFTVIPSNLRFLGLVFIFISLLLSFWQLHTMLGKTPIPYGSSPKTLLKDGPFKYTRNAFYLSLILISLGVAVYSADLVPFLIVILEFYIFNKFLIPPEEKVLEEKFGQEYMDYKKKVRRWI